VSEVLEKRLAELWGCIVTNYEVDVLRNTIRFELLCDSKENPKKFSVIFGGVSSMFFGNESGDDRFNIGELDEEWGLLDFHGIYYYEEGTRDHISISSDGGTGSYSSKPNFVIDIMFDAIISIEAQSIIINGEKFDNLI
jgi:hypothetical protein